MATMCSLVPRPEQLTMEITGQSGISPDGQVVFSGNSPHSLSAHTNLTQQQFSEFLEMAGGTRGHALLHLLPIPQLQSEKLQPDYSCLAKLSELAGPDVERYKDMYGFANCLFLLPLPSLFLLPLPSLFLPLPPPSPPLPLLPSLFLPLPSLFLSFPPSSSPSLPLPPLPSLLLPSPPLSLPSSLSPTFPAAYAVDDPRNCVSLIVEVSTYFPLPTYH